jgi:hypothetical protein
MRLLLSFLLIIAALVSALLLHEELTDAGGKPVEAANLGDRTRDLLQLRLGEAPILVVNSRRKNQPRNPAPSVPQPTPPEPAPEPAPATPQRFVFLEANGTLSEVSLKHLGTSHRWKEILELNGWTEAQSRKLQAGTKILLPAK